MQTVPVSQCTSAKGKRRERSERRRSQATVAVTADPQFVRARDPHVSRTSKSIAKRNAVALLVDSVVRQLRYLPANACSLVSQEDLPPRLLSRARSLGPRWSWHAWTDEVRYWFIATRLRNSRNASSGLLHVVISFFDSDGRRVAAGEWTLQLDGSWTLRRMLNAPISPPHTALPVHETRESVSGR
jgi:hypothetical protein